MESENAHRILKPQVINIKLLIFIFILARIKK